jgi:hypothetical protein
MRKNLRKQLMMLFLVSMGCLHGYAQTEKVLGIIVELTSGEKVECQLTKKPKLSFDGQTITLTATNVNVEYTVADFAKVSTGMVDEEVPEGIIETTLQQGDVKVALGFVRFSGFAPNEPIRVFSVAGILKNTYYTDVNGTLTLSVANLPQGISIIKANKQSIKITRQ